MEAEIVHIQGKGAVVGQTQDLFHSVQIAGRAIGGHTHHFVFAVVDLKAEPGGEGGIEEAEGMGKADFLLQADAVAPTGTPTVAPIGCGPAQGCGGPLAHAVDGQDGRFFEGR